MLKFLIEKEFKQLYRNAFLPKLIFLFPVFMMILLPWAANMEVKNVYLTIVDNDHSTLSQRLTGKIAASGYFKLIAVSDSYDEAIKLVERGKADIVMEIAPDFERKLIRGEQGRILLAANTVNGTKGSLGSSYLSAIVSEFGNELLAEHPVVSGRAFTPSIRMSEQMLFNPNQNYKLFIVPGLMVVLLTLLCGFLPALNIVGEKESGTIEQINVTPVGKFAFILAKLIPYWIIGVVVLTMCFTLAWLFYDILPVGHFLLILFFAAVFILSISGIGLVISNHSSTMQQAMFVMFFFLIILNLMSGLFTPIASMPDWAQLITRVNPLRYMIEVVRMVYLKGSGFSDLTTHLWVLLTFAFVLNTWAVVSYRKKS